VYGSAVIGRSAGLCGCNRHGANKQRKAIRLTQGRVAQLARLAYHLGQKLPRHVHIQQAVAVLGASSGVPIPLHPRSFRSPGKAPHSLGLYEEALPVAREYFPAGRSSKLSCPTAIQLCRPAGRFDLLMQLARNHADELNYVAAGLELQRKASGRKISESVA
jgi:hypothetical protein